MKVKVIIKEHGGIKEGEVVDLPLRVANIWIQNGYAIEVTNKPSKNKKVAPKKTK